MAFPVAVISTLEQVRALIPYTAVEDNDTRVTVTSESNRRDYLIEGTGRIRGLVEFLRNAPKNGHRKAGRWNRSKLPRNTSGFDVIDITIFQFVVLFSASSLMRFPRVKADGQGFYHCVSRVVEGRFIFDTSAHGSLEAERFIKLMRRLEAFSGIRVLTYALMSNLVYDPRVFFNCARFACNLSS